MRAGQPDAEAQTFLTHQWPPAPELTPAQQQPIFEAFPRAIAQINAAPPSQEEIEASVRHQVEIVERLVQELDEETSNT